jgi:ABC-type sugar transport system permease subunit
MRNAFRGTLAWYGFVLPPLFLILVFIGYPTFLAFEQSVYTESPEGPRFAGAFHFWRLFSSEVFWGALGNTALLGVAFLLIVIPLATILASMLNRLRRGATPLKVIYFLPQLTSAVAVAIMFNYVFQPEWGLLNGGLRALGIDPLPLWLADRPPAQSHRLSRCCDAARRLGGIGLFHPHHPRRTAVHIVRPLRRGGD